MIKIKLGRDFSWQIGLRGIAIKLDGPLHNAQGYHRCKYWQERGIAMNYLICKRDHWSIAKHHLYSFILKRLCNPGIVWLIKPRPSRSKSNCYGSVILPQYVPIHFCQFLPLPHASPKKLEKKSNQKSKITPKSTQSWCICYDLFT